MAIFGFIAGQMRGWACDEPQELLVHLFGDVQLEFIICQMLYSQISCTGIWSVVNPA